MLSLFIPLFLAQAGAPADDQVSTKVLYGVISAIFTGLALVLGKNLGKKEAQATRLEEPVPTVPTRKVPGLVTWNDLQAVVDRITRQEQHTIRLEQKLDEMSSEQAEQYRDILTAGSNRQMELVNHMDAIARAIHSRMDDMMRDNHQTKTRTGR